MMDYDIKLDTLTSKQSEFETLKSSAEDIYNEFNSSCLSSLSSELSSLSNNLKKPIERLKKGYTNSSTWLKNYVTELTNLEDELSSFSSSSLEKPVEFKGEFVDLFGKKTMPIIKTGGDIHANKVLDPSLTGVIGQADGSQLLVYQYNGQTFYIPNTKIDLDTYAAYIKKYKMYQNAGFQGGQCMLLSQYYASDMLSGKFTTKAAMDSHSGAPAVKMNERCRSTNEQDVLNYVYQEINAGNPVVLQVTQKNSNRGARHLVTMVGYTTDVKSAQDLTPDKILVLDCVDGRVQTLAERNRRLFNQGGTYQALGPTERFKSSIA